MSHPILRISLLFLLASSGFQCRRTHTDPSQNILTGKLVIDSDCSGQGAVQVLAGQIDSSRLMASWTDPDNDSVYHNVFRIAGVRDMCAISGYGVTKGDTFQFQIDPNPQNLVCNTCAIYTNAAFPPVSNSVMNVKKISNRLTGRLAVSLACGHFIIQVLSGIDSVTTQASWTNTLTDSVYTNVFVVNNVCTFGASGLVVGDVFTFEPDPNPSPQPSCYTCDIAFADLPTVNHAIKDIQKQK